MTQKFIRYSALTVAVGAALYAAAGYLVVPFGVKKAVEYYASKALERDVVVGDVQFNPWNWRLTVSDVAVESAHGQTPMLTLKRLMVDVSRASVTSMAPVVEALEVEGLHGTLTMSDENLKAAAADKSEKDASNEKSDSALPAFALYNVKVSDASLRLVDKTAGVDESITDFELQLPFVSTLPAQKESLVTPRLAFKLNDTPVVATGSTKPFGTSLEARLDLDVRKLDVAPLLRLVPAMRTQAASLEKGQLTTHLSVFFRNPTGGSPAQMTLSGTASLENVLVNQTIGKKTTSALEWKSVSAKLTELNLMTRKADVDNVSVTGLKVDLTRNDGALAFMDTAKAGKAAEGETKDEAKAGDASAPWQWSLGRFDLKNAQITWRDPTVNPSVRLVTSNLTASVDGLTSQANAKPGHFSLTANTLEGKFTLKGTASAAPLSVVASLSGEKLAAKPIEGYIKAATGLDVAATAGFTINARYTPSNTSASGTLSFERVTVKDKLDTLVSVQSGNLKLGKLDLTGREVALDQVVLESPMVNGRMTKKGLNFANLGATSTAKPEDKAPEAAPEKDAAPAAPWKWSLGRADLRNGTFNYRDDTVKPAAVATLSKVQVSATGFASTPGTKGELSLSAQVGKGSLSVSGTGAVEPAQAALALKVKNVNLGAYASLMRRYADYATSSGTVNVAGNLGFEAGQKGASPIVSWKGDIDVKSFVLSDKKGKTLFNFNQAALTGLDASNAKPLKFALARAELAQPGTRETAAVKDVVGFASALAKLAGKSTGKLDKVTNTLNKPIVLENVSYGNGHLQIGNLSDKALGELLAKRLEAWLGDVSGETGAAAAKSAK